jgi:hypothetical protein
MQYSEKFALTALFVCLLLAFFSLALFPLSVHSYCENRRVAAVLGTLELLLGAWCVLHKKASPTDRAISLSAAIFALLGIASSVGFIWWSTRLCDHMYNSQR